MLQQQNSVTVKAETDVDVGSAEHSIGLEVAEVHLPSAFAIKVLEPKVSLSLFVAVACGCTCICVKKSCPENTCFISGQLILHC
jgi:hypothetical protein